MKVHAGNFVCLVYTLLAGALFVGSALAQEQPTFQDPLVDHLAGNWVLKGTIAGQPTTHDVEADWVLNHQYLRIHEVSREKEKDGRPSYEANVFVGWNGKLKQYVCVWLDVFGSISPLSIGYAEKKPDEIPFYFHDGSTAFHNTFSYDPTSDTWKWKMDNDANGTLTPFARVTLERVK